MLSMATWPTQNEPIIPGHKIIGRIDVASEIPNFPFRLLREDRQFVSRFCPSSLEISAVHHMG
jgi:hypothetical protein